MLGSLLAHSLPRCKRLKSVLCVGFTALLIFLTAVFIDALNSNTASLLGKISVRF